MKNCEICNRYGMTTEATTEAMIENEYNNNKSLQPVCGDCAAQCNGAEAKQACPICECFYSAESDICSQCASEMEWQIQSEVEPCVYCDCMVTPLDGKQAASIGWDLVAAEHAKDCDWVLTQAHTLN
jgi:hypothetical protein